MLSSSLALIAVLSVAALTPGPNNLVVLRASSRAGLRGAMPAIFSIVLGGLLLLLLVALGGASVFSAQPSLRFWIGTLGAVYLAWLGASLLALSVRSPAAEVPSGSAGLPSGMLGLVGFQFLNPKGWVMVMTAVANVQSPGLRGYMLLVAMFAVIPACCLFLWAGLGALMAHALSKPTIQRRANAGMGVVLFVCAGLLLFRH